MGIYRLKKFITSKSPSSIQTVKWGTYKIVVIDISVMIHSFAGQELNKAIKRSRDLYRSPPKHDQSTRYVLEEIMQFITAHFINQGITALVVFDGKASVHKAEELAERAKEREVAKQKLGEQLEKMKEMDPFDRIESYGDLAKSYRRQRYYPAGIKPLLKDELTKLGVKWYQAAGEADELCAALVHEGIAEAVYSTDSDQLAYLTPVLITKIGAYKEKGTCEVIRVEQVLHDLELKPEQFVDLCILFGTDYNEPIKQAPESKTRKNKKKGKDEETVDESVSETKEPKERAVTVTKLFSWLNQYGSIDRFPPEIVITSLNHLECRRQFGKKESQSLLAAEPSVVV